MGRLGTPWVSLGVSWARLGGVLAASFWWLGGVLALGAVLGPFWDRFGTILGAFWESFGIVWMYLGIDFFNFVQKISFLEPRWHFFGMS